jgi:hypothetical protein
MSNSDSSATASLDPTESVTAVEAANLLVGLAISDTHQPVERIGVALERMQKTLGLMTHDQPTGCACLAGLNARLAPDFAQCIEGLQFHDRLMQQLTFVRDLLAAILEQQPADLAAYGERRWIALLAAIHEHAPLDPRFELFDLVPSEASQAAESSCELFE